MKFFLCLIILLAGCSTSPDVHYTYPLGEYAAFVADRSLVQELYRQRIKDEKRVHPAVNGFHDPLKKEIWIASPRSCDRPVRTTLHEARHIMEGKFHE